MKKLSTALSILMVTIFLSPTLKASSINTILPDSHSIKWVNASNLPAGAKLAILVGNPNKNEFYIARLKLPANFTIPVHYHLTNEYNTVISGTYYLGKGKTINKNNVIALPVGSFAMFPAGALHYGFTREATILEISGVGPWGTVPKKLT